MLRGATVAGFFGSRFGSESALPIRLGMLIVRPFVTSPKQGADSAVYLACSPDVEGMTRQYMYKRAPRSRRATISWPLACGRSARSSPE